jgi:Zn-dependent membrane protease YugP
MGIYIGNMYWQISYLLLAAAFIFTIVAQRRVSGQYARYASVACQKGISGSQAARMILDAHGLQDVSIGLTGGRLTDHYDPRKNTMALSNEVYNDCSISSVAVAAHECGHAIQEAEGYTFLKIRDAIAVPVSFVSNAAIPLMIIGIIVINVGRYTAGNMIFNIGVYAFIAVVVFQLITLPVELNASDRAISELVDLDIIYEEEVCSAQKVLHAAAMTYVAALAMAVTNLIRLLLIRGNN